MDEVVTPPPEPTPIAEPRAPAPPPAAPRDIIGGWRLVEMNGRAWPASPPEDNPPYPIILTLGEAVLVGHSQCLGFWRRYQRTGDQISTRAYGPVGMCARGLSEHERAFDQALSRIDRARVEDGRLRLSGPGAELVFTPHALRPPADFTGRWTLTRLDGQPAAAGAPPLTVQVTGDRIRAQSQCVGFLWRYRQTGPMIETFREDIGPVCERTLSGQEQRFEQLVTGLQDVTLRDDGTLVLTGGLRQAEFRRAP